MNLIERLAAWTEAGIISKPQRARLAMILRDERFSLYGELNALLYVGVLSAVFGLSWTFRSYCGVLGDFSIDDPGGAAAVRFFVLLRFARAYTNEHADSRCGDPGHQQTLSVP
jgi:hypothetical protein